MSHKLLNPQPLISAILIPQIFTEHSYIPGIFSVALKVSRTMILAVPGKTL